MAKNDTNRKLADDLEKVRQAGLRKNIIYRRDFERYRPLFMDNPGITPDQLSTLSEEFHQRFNMYSPIYVIDENEQPVCVIPPVFTPVRTMDNVPDGPSALEAFSSVMGKDVHPLRMDTQLVTERLKKAAGQILDSEKVREHEKIWREAINGIEKQDDDEGIQWE